MTKSILKSGAIKKGFIKRCAAHKTHKTKKKLEIKAKNYKKALLELIQNSKINHFNNFFRENKLNLFKTWECIRKIINICKKRTADNHNYSK